MSAETDLSELDKAIVRAWSAVVARGECGSATDVVDELSHRSIDVDAMTVEDKLAELAKKGQLG